MKDEQLVQDWLAAKATLTTVKEQEVRLRNLILPKVLKNTKIGSKTDIFGGFKVTATARVNYTIDRAELAILGKLSTDEVLCLDWKPTLKINLYNKLPDDSVLRQAVTAKPGQGTLAIK